MNRHFGEGNTNIMQSHMLLLALALVMGVTSCRKPIFNSSKTKEAWNTLNNPIVMKRDYEIKFSALPLQGQLPITPWADDYWPGKHGGLAFRWATPARELDGSKDFTYSLYTLEKLKTMDRAALQVLSPAEKYDILVSNYEFPTVKAEWLRTKPTDEDWVGICHGWAPASMLYEEPQPVVMTNADGIKIPFGSSDVKALLSYYQGIKTVSPRVFLGERCDHDLAKDQTKGQDIACRDTNAGAFHITLTNQIALLKESFLADVTRDREIWNHPVHRYVSTIVKDNLPPAAGAAVGTVSEVLVETLMTYTVEIHANYFPTGGTQLHEDNTKTYRYRLELDKDGKIIGGEWETDERPDFLWRQNKPVIEGYFAKLSDLYEASIKK